MVNFFNYLMPKDYCEIRKVIDQVGYRKGKYPYFPKITIQPGVNIPDRYITGLGVARLNGPVLRPVNRCRCDAY